MPGFASLYTFFCLPLLVATATHAAVPDAATVAAAEKQFAQTLANDHGLNEADVLATLAGAHYQQSVIDAISRPAEAKPWKDYRPIFVTDRRIADGAAFYRANAALLKKTQTDFGVPAELIVTILGVETNRVLVGDPLSGLAWMPAEEFESKWLFVGIVLRRVTAH